jgi:hypothetical protein
MIVVSHTPCFSLFPRLKIKLKAAILTQLMEAESQAVLNTFTQHDF